MATVNIQLNNKSYPVLIDYGCLDRLPKTVSKNLKGNRLFIIYDSNLYALYGKRINRLLRGYKPIELVVPAGEKTKSESEIRKIHDFWLHHNISRTDFVLAVGGGMVSDLVGYAAATILRGVRWGIVATSLLSMVDASVGGKTGINHKLGKNLIGAFWQPSFVISDLVVLETLPKREYVSGLGEIIKYAGLIGPSFTGHLIDSSLENPFCSNKQLLKIIKEAVAYKGEIVQRDEREGNVRMYLNLGHTIGHAIENTIGYNRIRHGEAVILGLWAAVELSLRKKARGRKSLQDYQKLIESFIGLVPYRKVEANAIHAALAVDKKRLNQKQKFILLDRPGRPIITSNLTAPTIKKVLVDLMEQYKVLGAR